MGWGSASGPGQGRIKGGAKGAAAPGPQFRGARIFGKCKKSF